MNNPTLPRLGAACGAVFAIALFAANGDGSQSFSGPRAIAGIAALTLALPFIAYLCSVLREAEGGPEAAAPGRAGWLASTALAAGVAGIVLKLGSGAPELAIHRAGLAGPGHLHQAIAAIADSAALLSLYPLAVFCAATAIVAFRTRVLPRWLAAGAAITGAALAVNGGFLSTSVLPAMLLFVLWTLLASAVLLRRTWRQPAVSVRAAESAGLQV
jgi:hypothetical protein